MAPGSKSSSDPGSVRSRLKRAFRGTMVWYGFLALPLFLIMVFVAYPTAIAFRDSVFTETPDGPQWAGLYHFGRLFSSGIFWGALGNTVLLGVAFLGITIPLATVLASMLNRLTRGIDELALRDSDVDSIHQNGAIMMMAPNTSTTPIPSWLRQSRGKNEYRTCGLAAATGIASSAPLIGST